jgi:hypothetical protein
MRIVAEERSHSHGPITGNGRGIEHPIGRSCRETVEPRQSRTS